MRMGFELTRGFYAFRIWTNKILRILWTIYFEFRFFFSFKFWGRQNPKTQKLRCSLHPQLQLAHCHHCGSSTSKASATLFPLPSLLSTLLLLVHLSMLPPHGRSKQYIYRHWKCMVTGSGRQSDWAVVADWWEWREISWLGWRWGHFGNNGVCAEEKA